MMRYIVGWMSTGCQMGAYENALAYAQQRLNFGKADRFVPDDTGPCCQDARQRDGVPVPDASLGCDE